MIYNIIGDIHGRTCWKNLVRTDCVNIFVGDYFSPYTPISFDDQRNNFMDIIMYKMEHPETVLLIGNHDEDHWHIRERYSRYDRFHVDEISDLFEENKDFFQIAYAIEDKAVVSHAGISMVWYEKYKNHNLSTIIDFNNQSDIETVKYYIDNSYLNSYNSCFFTFNNKLYRKGKNTEDINEFKVSTKEVVDFINQLWLDGKYNAFNFDDNSNVTDCYGDSTTHGPLWIRPSALAETNIFKFSNIFQIVGHSQFEHPSRIVNNTNIRFIDEIPISEHEEDKIIWCDCLGHNKESVIFHPGSNYIEINKEK